MEKNKNVIVPSKVVGIFEKSKNFGFVKPDDKKNFKKDIFIPKAFSKNARNGQKVVVEIIKAFQIKLGLICYLLLNNLICHVNFLKKL